jgi:hypothetical protein
VVTVSFVVDDTFSHGDRRGHHVTDTMRAPAAHCRPRQPAHGLDEHCGIGG